ncbi:MAG: hypothetical protein PHC83_01780 [Bacteroidales bacterium]|nr:hypothetical protein [Bacteroidales bacterium]MDD4208992.1 hypothetical protein [Bacteroidales bacterium]
MKLILLQKIANITPDGADFYGGAFLGTEFIFNASTAEIITSNKPFIIEELPLPGVKTNQFVNPDNLEKIDGGTGKGIMHEVTESYELGKISMKSHRNIQPAWHTWKNNSDGTIVEDYSPDYDIFKYVHEVKASPCP